MCLLPGPFFGINLENTKYNSHVLNIPDNMTLEKQYSFSEFPELWTYIKIEPILFLFGE